MSPELLELIKQEKINLENSKTSHLSLFKRVKMMKLINDVNVINKIFLACVQKVYVFWNAKYPKDESLLKIIKSAYDCLYHSKKEDFEKFADFYKT